MKYTLVFELNVVHTSQKFCVNYHRWAELKAGSLFSSEMEVVKTVILAFGSGIKQS